MRLTCCARKQQAAQAARHLPAPFAPAAGTAAPPWPRPFGPEGTPGSRQLPAPAARTRCAAGLARSCRSASREHSAVRERGGKGGWGQVQTMNSGTSMCPPVQRAREGGGKGVDSQAPRKPDLFCDGSPTCPLGRGRRHGPRPEAPLPGSADGLYTACCPPHLHALLHSGSLLATAHYCQLRRGV